MAYNNTTEAQLQYLVGEAIGDTSPFIEKYEERDPNPNDTNFPTQKRWLNTVSLREFVLLGFTSTGGLYQAIWIPVGGNSILKIGVPFGTSPVLPDSSGQINFTSSGGTVTITGSTNTINFDIPGGSVTESFQVQAATPPGVNPVVPTVLGVVTVNGATVANHTVPLETRTRALNTYNIEAQVAIARTGAPSNMLDAGFCSFDNVYFSVNVNGYVTITTAIGDVRGPAGASNNALARFDLSSGKLIKNSIALLDDSGNLSIGSPNVGADLVMTITNTDNTNAASDAFYHAVNGGPSGGDPYFAATVATAQGYSWGIDNSDSDKLKETNSNTGPSAGTTLRVMTSTGEQTLPLQPAFLVYVNAAITNVTGDATQYTIIYDTEVYDQNGDFDLVTGTFTASVTGKYKLGCICGIGGGTAITASVLRILTSNLGYRINGWQSLGGTTGSTQILEVLADMDAGDTATFTITTIDSGGKIDDVLGISTQPLNYAYGVLTC